jgi:hypothetical protein
MSNDYLVGIGLYKHEQPEKTPSASSPAAPISDDTFLQIADDLAALLNDGDELHIPPIEAPAVQATSATCAARAASTSA